MIGKKYVLGKLPTPAILVTGDRLKYQFINYVDILRLKIINISET